MESCEVEANSWNWFQEENILVIIGTCFCFSKEASKLMNVADGCIHNVDSCMKVCKCSIM